jgi:hypothetical protein
MKKRLLSPLKFTPILIWAFCFLFSTSQAQTCLPGEITFYTQTQIDNFTTNYPGCTQILNAVTINGSTITNLNGLSSLTSIGGYLWIKTNPALTSLSGLSSLTSVGGSSWIQNNTALTSLSGLSSLTSVGGSLSIQNNTALTSLSGLSALTSISGTLRIQNNTALTSLSGLSALTSVGGYLDISDNLALTSLGLSALTSVGGYLDIRNNTALTSLAGLENIDPTTINGSNPGTDINILDNTQLSTCEVQFICNALVTPSVTASFSNNATGCNNQTEVENACLTCPPGSITFSNQTQIDDFTDNYLFCTQILGDVIISGTSITNLDGLSVLTTIGGGLLIVDNPALASLGLSGLTTIGGYLNFNTNPALTSLSGLSSLTSIGGNFNISDNAALASLGLSALISINGNLAISNNPVLPSLSGLLGLTSIGGYLNISDNAVLTSLVDLENIDPTTISNTEPTAVDIEISNNLQLSICDALSICNALAMPGTITNISNNATGCLNQTEVELACITCLPVGIIFSTQTQINNFTTDYPSCTQIPGDVSISGSAITNLDGLLGLTYIGGYLRIDTNPALTSLSGLSSLTSVGGYLSIFDNPVLASLSGLSVLTSVSGDLDISNNTALTSLGLSGLTSIGGSLDIVNNTALTSLAGLENIDPTTINNPDPAGVDIYIVSNTLLCSCEVLSICDALDIPSIITNISNNAIGCNSQTEVENACKCPIGVITFSTQTQIDDFATNYPDCAQIKGDVIINGSGITNLDGLLGLTSIGGNLTINNNTVLTSLSGLSALTSIGGNLSISYNTALTSGLSAVTSIGGNLDINNNAGLTSLGLSAVTSIVGNLDINNNAALTSLGLSALTSIIGNLDINNNAALTSLGLSALTSIGENLDINNNPALTSLLGLSALTSIGENLDINNNPALTSLVGLSALTSIGENLDINNNAGLTSLVGLSALTSIVGNLDINNNAGLTSLVGLSALTSIVGNLDINNNAGLTSLGLSALTSIDGWLWIHNNPALTSLGLSALTSLGGQLYIDTNGALTSLSGLSALTSLGGQLYIGNNNSLTSLSELSALTSIGGGIDISTNAVLPSLSGLSSLTSIGGILWIQNNPALTSLSGLSALTSIDGWLWIQNNAVLTSLAGLENIDPTTINNPSPAGTDISVVNNLQLSNCEVESICNALDIPGVISDISNNSNGCNSEEESCSSCLLGGIIFSTQTQIDNFTTNYSGCTRILGSVTISGSTITNLDGLSGLTFIGGNLDINNNGTLTTMLGLSALTSLGGNLDINNNAVLTSGLSVLTSIGGNLSISYNAALTSGLALTSLGGSIFISNNAALTSFGLTGFPYLALSGLSSIGGYLHIENNDALTSLLGFSVLTSIDGYLHIDDNAVLPSLAGLYHINPTTINHSNPTGIDIYIGNNTQLSTCEVQPICAALSIPDIITEITNNATGCNSEAEVQNACPTCLPGGFTFSTQAEIDNFSTDYPDCTQISGPITISGSAITNLDGLSGLTSIGGSLGFYNNPVLISLSGLSGLISIGGELFIGFNGDLNSLSGLSGLISIDGYLVVRNNDVLSSLAGLENINPTTIKSPTTYPDINILNNPQLSTCAVQSICDALDIAGIITDISNNAAGCNSQAEVETDCTTLGYTAILDVNFEQKLIDLGIDSEGGPTNGWILNADAEAVTGTLDVNSSNISDLTGIEAFTSLSVLDCHSNMLTSLDLTQNTGLTLLYCFGNQLTSLDLSLNTALNNLRCYSNQLTELDIRNGNNNNFTYFDATNNSLTCISVDDPTYSTANWANVDAGTYFGSDCLCPSPAWSVPSASSTSIISNASCIDADGWTHYLNSADEEILLSLEIGTSGAVVPRTAVTLDPDGATDVFWVSGVNGNFINNPDGAAFMRRKWDVTPTTQPSSSVGVRFYYTTDEYNAVNTEISNQGGTALTDHTQMRFFKVLNSSNPFNVGSLLESDGIDLEHGTASSTQWSYNTFGSDHYGEFYVDGFSGGGGGGASGGAPLLPIELLYIRGEALDQSNKITWASATEENSSHFEVERSSDGITFEMLGIVAANGNTVTNQSYVLLDEKPLQGIGYYRLKMVDLDDTFEYSNIVSVSFNKKNNEIQLSISPNPATDVVHFAISKDEINNAIIEIHSITGQLIFQKMVNKNDTNPRFDWNTEGAVQGIYIATLTSGNERTMKKIIIQ